MYSDMDVYMAHGTHQSPMTCKHSPHHGTTYCAPEMKKKVFGFLKSEGDRRLQRGVSSKSLVRQVLLRSPARGKSLEAKPVMYPSRSAVIGDKV
jgi:hypothetical protein